MSIRDGHPRVRGNQAGAATQQHAERMARGRLQRQLRSSCGPASDEVQLMIYDPDQWQRHTAWGMLRDLENSGVDESLESLRAGWATPLSAAAQRQKRSNSDMFGFTDDLPPDDSEPSELNRRGDIAARRLQVLKGLRKVAAEPAAVPGTSGQCLAIADCLPLSGSARMRRVRASVPNDVDSGLGLDAALNGGSSSSYSSGSATHARRWRGPLDAESDDEVYECDPRPALWQATRASGAGVLALRPTQPHRPSKAPGAAAVADDPWAAWESRWAEAFQRMEGMARARRHAQAIQEEEERRRLWEHAERLREEEVQRQRERKNDRAAGPARTRWEDADKQSRNQGTATGTGSSPQGSRKSTKSGVGSPGNENNRSGSGACPPNASSGSASSWLPRKEPPKPAEPQGPRFATFAAYEEAWEAFERKAKEGQPICYADIPWPLALPTVSGAVAADSAAEKKKKLRGALLRWHPDKWAPLLGNVRDADQARVTDQIKEVTRRILEEKQRFGG